ncbi:murein DD-endopeptidase MepM/ murein hydrolase activator NlpD [Chryseobacterium ginsenosidimutans]|uniref:DUF4280 and LysM peptidoglycan-binding domain-containing protein n=1 Tax=Chryseobacterium ginsenosidimutans TaxID=687846 RepID=UPI0021697BD0|nr:PAAR-like protein [Chryseobacterium ginsenosidimutans]MCS3870640.1 murein DD-endopeptidase MepM/ murein hydrolase activator NlpD [Chryseobacterium ginsenosidimutans]
MKKYTVQKGDTLSSIASQFNVKDAAVLRSFHNIYCPLEDLIGYDPIPGKEIIIPEDQKYLKEEPPELEEVNSMNGYDDEADEEDQQSEKKDEKKEEEEKQEEKKQNESKSSEHDGKYFVVQKGMAQCNQGFKFPKFKVTSHQKHYWNDADGQADFLAVTEDDLQFDPPAQPFGQCKLKPSSGGYLPCAYAAAGKWKKPYEKVKVMGKSCLTEASELMCSTGGKIKVFKHGQESEAGKSHANNANTQEQQIYNPIMDYNEFKEEVNDTDQLYYS